MQNSDKKKSQNSRSPPKAVAENKKRLAKKHLAEYKPSPILHLMDDMSPIETADDDVRKLERLQLINASARYELLTAN